MTHKISTRMYLLFLLAMGGLFASPVLAEELIISRGTTIHVIDGPQEVIRYSAEFRNKPLTIVPAGTRMIMETSREVRYLGNRRSRVLTENGIWGYVNKTKRFYWDQTSVEWFAKKFKTVVFIKKHGKGKLINHSDCNLVDLTRGEAYKFLDYKFPSIIIEKGKDKSINCESAQNKDSTRIQIPNSIATVVDFQASFNERGRFRRKSFRNQVKTLKSSFVRFYRAASNPLVKGCGTTLTQQQVSNWKAGVEASIRAGFQSVGVGAQLSASVSAEISKNITAVTSYPADRYLVLQFFLHSAASGPERLTTERECPDYTSPEMRFITSRGTPVPFSYRSLKEFDLKPNLWTGKIVVSCLEEYFKMIDYLRARNLREHEISFFASRVLQVNQPEDLRRCS